MLNKSTLGIVGLGSIGGTTAKIAKQGFGMRVIGLKRDKGQIDKDLENIVDKVVDYNGLDELLSESDYVVNVLPNTPETIKFYKMEQFKKMKETGVFINIGRGASVEEKDLIKALKEGVIKGAALDVVEVEPLGKDSELWEMDNVYITSHCVDQTETYYEDLFDIFLENLERYVKGQELINHVNKVL